MPPSDPERSPGDPPAWDPFPVVASERLYDSPWCGLRRDLLRLPDGREREHHVVEISDAVVVVPVRADGAIVMIWQHRHPHGRSHWEVPAGRVHSGESPEEAARRELSEETGHEAARWLALPGFYPINGISAHWAHAFLALGCRETGPLRLDPAERIVVRPRPRAEVERLLREGAIRDGFAALSLYAAFARLDGGTEA